MYLLKKNSNAFSVSNFLGQVRLFSPPFVEVVPTTGLEKAYVLPCVPSEARPLKSKSHE